MNKLAELNATFEEIQELLNLIDSEMDIPEDYFVDVDVSATRLCKRLYTVLGYQKKEETNKEA